MDNQDSADKFRRGQNCVRYLFGAYGSMFTVIHVLNILTCSSNFFLEKYIHIPIRIFLRCIGRIEIECCSANRNKAEYHAHD